MLQSDSLQHSFDFEAISLKGYCSVREIHVKSCMTTWGLDLHIDGLDLLNCPHILGMWCSEDPRVES